MEESEKRRERLKAMRMEAAQTKVSDTVDTSAMPGYLSNPLVEGSATLPVQEDSCMTPRFDFYTDPMSAFSSNKRRSKVANQIQQDYLTPSSNSGYTATMARMSSSLSGPRNCEMTPSPNPPFQPNYSPGQGINQAQGLHHSSGPYRSPIEMASSFPAHQGTPGVWNGSNGMPRYGVPSNSPRGGNFPSPGFRPVGSPGFRPVGSPGFRPAGSPGFRPAGSPSFRSGRGRGHWFNNSPSPVSGRGGSSSPNSGRGRSGWFGNSMSPGSGRGHGRGLGFHAHVSAQDRPELFYNKSMVEDPWKFLKPVIWSKEKALGKIGNTSDSPKSWLPKSINMKKPRVSEATNESSSQQSLAEYLAASFNEAVNDASGI
ncbi:hypothetical protein PVL29_023529 [Vitis rotundifolia]|uniref:Uncharacterized protein n=1 Tax=Vitis rotundifolia TaxID=103349 RepID=A0AA38YP49_VITRO|nr:hypothetical protein PVL29_023529 [Vitis rotundifolia]